MYSQVSRRNVSPLHRRQEIPVAYTHQPPPCPYLCGLLNTASRPKKRRITDLRYVRICVGPPWNRTGRLSPLRDKACNTSRRTSYLKNKQRAPASSAPRVRRSPDLPTRSTQGFGRSFIDVVRVRRTSLATDVRTQTSPAAPLRRTKSGRKEAHRRGHVGNGH